MAIPAGVRAMAALMLAEGCATFQPKPDPSDACRTPCIEAIGRVDVYELKDGICSCYRAADNSTNDPGAFVEVPL